MRLLWPVGGHSSTDRLFLSTPACTAAGGGGGGIVRAGGRAGGRAELLGGRTVHAGGRAGGRSCSERRVERNRLAGDGLGGCFGVLAERPPSPTIERPGSRRSRSRDAISRGGGVLTSAPTFRGIPRFRRVEYSPRGFEGRRRTRLRPGVSRYSAVCGLRCLAPPGFRSGLPELMERCPAPPAASPECPIPPVRVG